jgi:zinc protease
VVGDVDPKATEQVIKKLFSDLKNPKNMRPREKFTIELKGQNQYFVGTDKELTLPTIQVIAKYPEEKTVTKEDIRTGFCKSIFNYILSERFTDLSKKANSPFLQAGAGAGNFLANIDAFSTELTAEPQKLQEAFKTVWTEIERVKKNGFSDAEVDRAKISILKNYEYAYGERDKMNSDQYVNEYMRNFLEDEAISGIEYEFSLCKELLAGISLQDINKCASKYMLDTNRDILVLGPEKDKALLPSEADITGWMLDVQKSDIMSIAAKENKSELMQEKPVGGSIVKESKDEALNLTQLTLSNGIKVYLKPTDFKNDEILINAFSPGGTSLYGDKDYMSATVASEFINYSGLSEFTLSELQKHLTGKRVSISPFIGERNEGLSGMSSQSDLETAFQMIYLYFDKPRKDTEGFQSELEKAKVSLANRGSDPSTAFSDTISAVLGNYSIRRIAPTVDLINQIDLNRSYQIYKERFEDAGDFTFTFVGNFDIEKIKPLIAQYLGALIYTGRKEEARNLGIHIPNGKIARTVKKGIEKKSSVNLIYSGIYEYSPEENSHLNALADLLTIRLLETLREKESGVYGVSANASYSKYPENRYSINIGFGCAPENVEKLITATNKIIAELQNTPSSSEEIQKVVSEDLRSFELQLKNNSFWLGYISGHLMSNDDMKAVFTYPDRLKNISPATLEEAARKYLTGENYARFVLDPEN